MSYCMGPVAVLLHALLGSEDFFWYQHNTAGLAIPGCTNKTKIGEQAVMIVTCSMHLRYLRMRYTIVHCIAAAAISVLRFAQNCTGVLLQESVAY